ncbi:MAG TPA: iron-sulfur cluster assembly scaffold protein, partial [Bacteroidetes bacterium]|nr:iron-sulfur cluster assembly scaffold protein [Bacteroidota bacterium]
MAIKYSNKVIEHFMEPQNVGEVEGADVIATEGSPACGDMITFSLKINPETRVIEDVKFRSFGCASNIATASMTTLLAKGKTTEEIKRMRHRDITKSLDGLPAVKMHCSVLAVDALKSAVHKWEVNHGLAVEEKPELDRREVWKALTDVLNPRTGLSLVEAKVVNNIEIEQDEGRVFIEIMLCDLDEMFA